jgi:hypothetical protein
VTGLRQIEHVRVGEEDNPVPNPPVTGTVVFLQNMERLKLEPEKILSVHSLNPDRLATKADILKSLGN